MTGMEMLQSAALVTAIFWMFVSMYCLMMIALASRNAMRMMVAWYQDWFDSVFEEGDSPEPEAMPASEPEPVRPAAAAPARAASEEPSNLSLATGAGTQKAFQRRKRT